MKRRQNVLIVLFVIAIMAVYTGYEANKPQPIDWSPNFSISKKSPYGTYSAFGRRYEARGLHYYAYMPELALCILYSAA